MQTLTHAGPSSCQARSLTMAQCLEVRSPAEPAEGQKQSSIMNTHHGWLLVQGLTISPTFQRYHAASYNFTIYPASLSPTTATPWGE